MIDHFKISKTGKDQLITLKRRTGLDNWNVLCRWAFCVSLAETSPPRDDKIPADSNLEMTWRTFAGENDKIYWELLRLRCISDRLGTDSETMHKAFRLHVHRGISYLVGNSKLTTITGLLDLAVTRI